MIRTPPAEVRAQGFMREIRWNLRHNWPWYVAVAAVAFLVGHFI